MGGQPSRGAPRLASPAQEPTLIDKGGPTYELKGPEFKYWMRRDDHWLTQGETFIKALSPTGWRDITADGWEYQPDQQGRMFRRRRI